VDLNNIRRGLAFHLLNTDCANFIDELLNRTATANNPRVTVETRGADVLDIFDMLRASITRASNAGGGQQLGSIGGGDASIKVSPTIFGGNPTAAKPDPNNCQQ
jgi:hypothetical protein